MQSVSVPTVILSIVISAISSAIIAYINNRMQKNKDKSTTVIKKAEKATKLITSIRVSIAERMIFLGHAKDQKNFDDYYSRYVYPADKLVSLHQNMSALSMLCSFYLPECRQTANICADKMENCNSKLNELSLVLRSSHNVHEQQIIDHIIEEIIPMLNDTVRCLAALRAEIDRTAAHYLGQRSQWFTSLMRTIGYERE